MLTVNTECVRVLILSSVANPTKDLVASLGRTKLTVDVCDVDDPSEASRLLSEAKFDILFLPVGTDCGAAVVNVTAFARQYPDIPVVAILNQEDHSTGMLLIAKGAEDYINHTVVDINQLEKVILSAITRKRASRIAGRAPDDYQKLFDLNPMPMWAFTPESLRIVLVNAAAIRHYGYTREEFLHLTLRDIRPTDEVERFSALFTQYFGESYHSGSDSWRHQKKDGSIIDVELAVEKVLIGGESLFLATITDVTESKRMSQALLDSQQRLALAMKYGRMITLDIDHRTSRFHFSNLADTLFGIPVGHFKEIPNVLQIVHPDDHGKVLNAFHDKHFDSDELQFRVVRPDNGETMWIERRSYKMRDAGGRITESRGLLVDITKLKTAQVNLTKSYRELEEAAMQQAAILNSIPAHIALLDDQGTIIAVNERWKQFAHENGGNLSDVGVGANYFGRDEGNEFASRMYEGIRAVMRGDLLNFSIDYPCHPPNQKRWFKGIVTPLPLQQKSGAVVMHLEITERKVAEEKLRASEVRFRTLIETAGDMLVITDASNIIQYVSPNINHVLQYEIGPLDQKDFSNLIHPDDKESFQHVFNKVIAQPGRLYHQIYRVSDKSGKWRWTEGTILNMLQEEAVAGIVNNFRDITDRIAIENELYQNKYLLEKANEVAKFGCWTYSLLETKLTWSVQMFEIFGLRSDCAITLQDFISFVHPDDVDLVNARLDAAIRHGANISCDHRIVLKDGSVRWILQQAEAFLDDAGNASAIIGVCKDITDRKRQEEQIRQSKNNLDALINNTKDLIWSVDKEYKLVSANEAFRQLMLRDFDHQLAEGHDMLSLAGTTFPDAGKTWYDRALIGELCMFDTVYQGKLSRQYWEVTLNPIIDHKDVIGVSCFIRDVTTRKETEMAMLAINERYEILLKATNDAVWDLDLKSGFVQWNAGLHTIFGHSLEDGRSTLDWWTEHVHPQEVAHVNASLNRVFERKEGNWGYRYRFRCSNGSYRYTHDKGYVLYENGEPVRMIGAMQDVHELTQYRMSLEQKVLARTRELEEALKKERELVGMKSRFVSIASHEFRTPLSTMQFSTDFLRLYGKQVSEKEFQRKLDTIETQINHMMYLLDDVLTVGKGDSGKITVTRTAVKLKELFDQLIMNVRRSLKSSHEVEVSIDVVDEFFLTDEKLMHNIFTNLLSNAMKFSPGQTKVYLQCSQIGDGYEILVADQGLGISAEDIDTIFEPFNRGRNSGAIPGTGLGLTIVRHAVELLGGNITISSSDKFNTIFRVVLPSDGE